jgi:uncharacterized protein DUF6457
MNRDEWIAAFAERAGIEPPSAAEVEALLDLAAVAAHSSERTAAPIACWVAGRSGLPLEQLQAEAEGIAPQRP